MRNTNKAQGGERFLNEHELRERLQFDPSAGTPREKRQCGIIIRFLGMWKLYFMCQDMGSKAEFPNVKLSGRQSFIFKNCTTVGSNFNHFETLDGFLF